MKAFRWNCKNPDWVGLLLILASCIGFNAPWAEAVEYTVGTPLDEKLPAAVKTVGGFYVAADSDSPNGNGLVVSRINIGGSQSGVQWTKTYPLADTDQDGWALATVQGTGVLVAGAHEGKVAITELDFSGAAVWGRNIDIGVRPVRDVKLGHKEIFQEANRHFIMASAGKSIWVARLNADGTTRWSRLINLPNLNATSLHARAKKVMLTADNNIAFLYGIEGLQLNATEPVGRYFVTVMDPLGNVLSEHDFGGCYLPNDMAQTMDGGFIVGGRLGCFTTERGFTQKVGGNPVRLWKKHFNHEIKTVSRSSSGGVLITHSNVIEAYDTTGIKISEQTLSSKGVSEISGVIMDYGLVGYPDDVVVAGIKKSGGNADIWIGFVKSETGDRRVLDDFGYHAFWSPDNYLGWWDIDGPQAYQHLHVFNDRLDSRAMRLGYNKKGRPWSLTGGYLSPNNPNKDFRKYNTVRIKVKSSEAERALVKLRDRNYHERDVSFGLMGKAFDGGVIYADFEYGQTASDYFHDVKLSDIDNVLIFMAPGQEKTNIGHKIMDDIQLVNTVQLEDFERMAGKMVWFDLQPVPENPRTLVFDPDHNPAPEQFGYWDIKIIDGGYKFGASIPESQRDFRKVKSMSLWVRKNFTEYADLKIQLESPNYARTSWTEGLHVIDKGGWLQILLDVPDLLRTNDQMDIRNISTILFELRGPAGKTISMDDIRLTK